MESWGSTGIRTLTWGWKRSDLMVLKSKEGLGLVAAAGNTRSGGGWGSAPLNRVEADGFPPLARKTKTGEQRARLVGSGIARSQWILLACSRWRKIKSKQGKVVLCGWDRDVPGQNCAKDLLRAPPFFLLFFLVLDLGLVFPSRESARGCRRVKTESIEAKPA